MAVGQGNQGRCPAACQQHRTKGPTSEVGRVQLHSGEPADLEIEADRELSWLRRTAEGRMQEGILDRLVVTRRQGVAQEALVIDWKTDRVASGDEIMHADSYRPQLEAYREAASQLTGLEIHQVAAVVVFVRNGILVPLET